MKDKHTSVRSYVVLNPKIKPRGFMGNFAASLVLRKYFDVQIQENSSEIELNQVKNACMELLYEVIEKSGKNEDSFLGFSYIRNSGEVLNLDLNGIPVSK